MSPLTLPRHARRLLSTGATAALLTLAAVPAHAESSGQAEAKARAILAQVHQVQAQVAKAEQQYAAALSGVATSVNAEIAASRASDTVTGQVEAAQQQLDERIRAVYESGGPIAMYATALDSGSVTQFQEQAVVVSRLIAADQLMVAAGRSVRGQVDAQVASTHKQALAKIHTERSVARSATRVLTLLAREQQLLAQANARVASLRAMEAARAALAAETAQFGAITSQQLATLQVLPAPAAYMALYHRAAATCPGLSWTVLAAIGQVESGHGRDPSTSYAGAMGPMQFLPSTFSAYAVDGNHDGRADIMNPADAIFTAARYLCANGAGGGPGALARAIWHYNHADWYVQMVLALAKLYAG